LALRASEALSAQGVECTVMAVASMSPAPVEDLRALMSGFPFAVAVEAHYATGGLGSLVCEVAAEHNLDCRVTRCGVTRNPSGEQGDQDFMNRLHGLAPERLAAVVLENRRRIQSASNGGAVPDWSAKAPVAPPIRS